MSQFAHRGASSEPGASPGNLLSWEDVRAQMPVTERWAYFDHAAVAPLPEAARAAIEAWAAEAASDGDTLWPRWAERIETLRGRYATLLGADTDEIALVPNTTTGIHIVAEGFPWAEGDRVVFPADEFPSNAYPWLNLRSRGVVAEPIERPSGGWTTDALIDACDARTRMIAVSWVGFASGWRIDVASLVEAAHARGIAVFLDAIQGLGVFPLDLTSVPVDFLAADGHKWMLGPEGAGVLFVARRHLDRLRPLIAGWHSVEEAHDFDHLHWKPKRSAQRYEGGSQNMVGFAGLDASVRLLEQSGWTCGSDRLAERVLQIVAEARERLNGLGAQMPPEPPREHASGILPFQLPGCDPHAVRRHCLERGVVLSVRGGRLRISPHVYNNVDDLDRLVDALRSAAASC